MNELEVMTKIFEELTDNDVTKQTKLKELLKYTRDISLRLGKTTGLIELKKAILNNVYVSLGELNLIEENDKLMFKNPITKVKDSLEFIRKTLERE